MTVTSRSRPTRGSATFPRAPRSGTAADRARRRRRGVDRRGHADHPQRAERLRRAPAQGARPVVLERRRHTRRRDRRRRAAAPRAGLRRDRRRGAVPAGVHQPVHREHRRQGRVPGDGAGLQHFLAEDYCSVAPDRLHRQRGHPRHRHRGRDRRDEAGQELGCDRCTCRRSPPGGPTPAPRTTVLARRARAGMAITAHGAWARADEPADGRLRDGPVRHGDDARPARSRRRPRPSCSMVVSGMFDRIPELRIYFAETNASWMPGVFYMMDDSYELFRDWYGVDLEMKPSEYACEALRLRHRARSDGAADAATSSGRGPHVGHRLPALGGLVPGEAAWIEDIFARAPDDERRKVLVENPCRLLRPRRAGRAHPHASVNLSLRSRVIEDKRPSGQARKCAPTSTGFAAQAQATELGLPATPTTVGRDDVPIRAPLEPVAA